MKTLLRWLLWKFCRRDVLVLNPSAAVVTRNANYTLIGTNAAVHRRFIPMRYNYHTPRPWRLVYALRNGAAGTLRYRLSVPGKDAFCEVNQRTQLPTMWTITLEGEGLSINGERLSLLPGKTIPYDTPWLMGEFELQTDAGETWIRRTGHRVRGDNGEVGSGYFTGAVYKNYEAQATLFPQQILTAIQRHHSLRGKLLDVGCATGLLVEHAMAAGLDAEGLDVSAWAVERANARTRGRCRVLNLDRASASDFTSRYDIITLHSVIEHLAEPARALALLFHLCRPGGVVFLETLNADSLMHRLQQNDWGGFSDPTHQSPWLTADWLTETSSRLGFEVVALKRYGVWNDNVQDEVWHSFASLIQIHPAGVLLEDHFGDFVEMILRRPAETNASSAGEEGDDEYRLCQ